MDYRNTLIEAVNYLDDVRTELFSKAINVEMYGNLKEINDVFELGDEFEFCMEHLETSTDTNVQNLTSLLKLIDRTIDRIKNLNNIQENEL